MAAKRVGLSKKTRFEVFKRDAFTCQYCGGHPPGIILHVDHVVAVAAGGTNSIDNLVTSCESCNLGKGARDLKVAPEPLSVKAKLIAEKEAQLLGYQAILEAKRERIEDEMWRVADALIPGSSENGISRKWTTSIKMFVENLGLHECLHAAEIAESKYPHNNKKAFLYFCGVCWRKIKGDLSGQV